MRDPRRRACQCPPALRQFTLGRGRGAGGWPFRRDRAGHGGAGQGCVARPHNANPQWRDRIMGGSETAMTETAALIGDPATPIGMHALAKMAFSGTDLSPLSSQLIQRMIAEPENAAVLMDL